MEPRRVTRFLDPASLSLLSNRRDDTNTKGLAKSIPDNHLSSSQGLTPLEVRPGSPWKVYQKRYEINLAGTIALSQRIPATIERFAIRWLSGPDANSKLKEFIPLPIFPEETHLAAIAHQVLEGISYLASEGLMHGSLNCSHIVLSKDGNIKIANPDCCLESKDPKSRRAMKDTEGLGRAMITLMDKFSPGEKFGLTQPDRWSEEAVNFISLTIAASPDELRKHNFLNGAPQKEELVWLIDLAGISAPRSYRVSRQ
ncbi:hypothetical protein ACJ73_03563 [Blastomyces percursus]|uniref:Protein kinase domain-containing protein n=1 Tax=Blastomyces percursus TaxID=1658174 RepID=A0A1J9R966_9EURO|nr:hypothetical protein ACJ73_03563 [Blastomyces percursus]